MLAIINQILYYMMLVGFFGLSIQHPDKDMKIVGLLLTVVNALIFRTILR